MESLSNINENLLYISWHNPDWPPHMLNAANILMYFSHESNPFYDRQCNNEVLKMQKRTIDQLKNMTGVEYSLMLVQEPILFVIRKARRSSPTKVVHLADYYIINGQVHQSPDVGALMHSRLSNATSSLLSAFSDIQSRVNYSTTRGYYWNDTPVKSQKHGTAANAAYSVPDEELKPKNIASTFQMQRVDPLLSSMAYVFSNKTANVIKK